MDRPGEGSVPWGLRLLPLWGLLAGLVAGAVWGGLARLWMRVITTEAPSFSWSGTLFIVGIFAITGMIGGLLHGARRRRWRGRPMVALRLLGLLPLVLLGSGAGVVLAPTLVFGGLALGRSSWPRPVRAVLAGLALAAVAAVHVDAAQDWPHSPARLVGAVVLCLVVYGGAVAALAQAFAATPGATLPPAARWVLLPLLLLPALAVTGVGAGAGPGALLIGVLAATLLAGLVVWGRRRRAARPAAEPAPVPAPREPEPEPGTSPAGVTATPPAGETASADAPAGSSGTGAQPKRPVM